MIVRQFRYASDNFSYVLHGNQSAMAIDPGAVEAILSYVESSNLKLIYIANTHMHPDHTPGNRDLLGRTDSEFLDNRSLRSKKSIALDGEKVEIYHTPGHTEDSLTFFTDGKLITGDTLFNGTVGNCFTGDLKAFYQSIRLIFQFPAETMVYAGHDYVRYAMQFAKGLEPDNREIDRFLAQYDPTHVFSTLADELRINPYVRFNDEGIISMLKKRGLPVESEYMRWKSLMEVY